MIKRNDVQFKEDTVSSRTYTLTAKIVAEIQHAFAHSSNHHEVHAAKSMLTEKLRRVIYGDLEEKIHQSRNKVLRELFDLNVPTALPKERAINEFNQFCNELLDLIQWKKD